MACDAIRAESPKTACYDGSYADSLTQYSSTTVDEVTDSSQLSHHAMGLPEFDNDDEFYFMRKNDSFLSFQNRSNRYGWLGVVMRSLMLNDSFLF